MATDWGVGPTDNTPDDVSSNYVGFTGYGAGETFTCNASTSSCQ